MGGLSKGESRGDKVKGRGWRAWGYWLFDTRMLDQQSSSTHESDRNAQSQDLPRPTNAGSASSQDPGCPMHIKV